LVTWTIPAVTWTIPAVTWTIRGVAIWCVRSYALLGLSLPLPGGVRLVLHGRPYRLCHQLHVCFECKNNVVKVPTLGEGAQAAHRRARRRRREGRGAGGGAPPGAESQGGATACVRGAVHPRRDVRLR
jgi:hypothetical protein